MLSSINDNSAMYYGTVSHVQPSNPTAQQPSIPNQANGTVSHVQPNLTEQEANSN